MFFLPILTGVAFGSVHLVLLAIMLAGILLIEDRHDVMGGMALGFGATLKYFPAFLILYYLLRGRWRAVASASITALVFLLAEWLMVGRDTMLASIGAASAAVRAGSTLFQGGHWMRALPGGVALAYLAGIAFIAAVVWLQRRPETARGDLMLGAGWAIATMLLLSPLVWWSYMTWLLPTLLACLGVALRYAGQARPGRGWRAWAARWWPLATGAVAYALLLVPQINGNFREQALGTLLLWLLSGALYLWSAGVRLAPLVRQPIAQTVRA
jgi:glycosyl transferase family 87